MATLLTAELKPETVRAWEEYVRATEARITAELEQNDANFHVFERLSEHAKAEQHFNSNRVYMTRIKSPDMLAAKPDVPSGLIHHWLGAVEIPRVTLAQALDFIQNYDAHHQVFDDVSDSRILKRQGDLFEIFLQLRQQKIITVVSHSLLAPISHSLVATFADA